MQIRDRIRELRRVPAKELLPNPRNWRTHPQRQRDVLRGLLAEIGYADALLARETAEGKLMLIDGHLRAETTPDSAVPVLVLDVSEEEADKLLATLDPLAGLAGSDTEKLTDLLSDVRTGNAAVGEMLADMAKRAIPAPSEEPADQQLNHQYNILITCEDEHQQVALLQRLSEEGLQCRAFVV